MTFMNIKRNYKCGVKLIACVLLIGLFFQSCGSFLDQVKSQMKEEEVQNIKEEKKGESIEVTGLTLVGENHSKIDGMKYCYERISGFAADHKQEVLNFFVEKDRKRLDNAVKEVSYLSSKNIFNIDYKEAIKTFGAYIGELKVTTDPTLYKEVYTNIIGKHDEDGLIANRFWFLKIINDFKGKINIYPIDGSFEEVINHQSYQDQAIEKDINKLLKKNQEEKDSIMRSTLASRVRDEIMICKLLTELIKSDTRNIAIVGAWHSHKIQLEMEDKGITVEPISKS